MNQATWRIDHECPQCGAPIILEETDRILACPFCRTKLILFQDGGFRYIIPHTARTNREIHYLPYWRLKGSHFYFRDQEVRCRFVDISKKAVSFPLIPLSLGVRPQAVKLKFLTPEVSGFFAAPQNTLQEAISGRGGHTMAGSGEYVGEVISLIYLPVYLHSASLFDALTDRCLGNLAESELLYHLARNEAPAETKVLFLSTLCPKCGWDLAGEKDALSLTCANCGTLWLVRDNCLETLDFKIMPSNVKADIYLPFWSMKIKAEGFVLDSYADLIRLANLPKLATPQLEDTPLSFWSPAFRINPAAYLRWSRQMTVFQPAVEKHADPLPSMPPALHPVTLPLTEAAQGVKANIGQMLADKRRLLQVLAATRIVLIEAELVYHPFRRKNSELIHTGLGLSLNRNALSLAFHLS